MSTVVRSSSYDIFIGNDTFLQLSKFLGKDYVRSKKFILVDEHTKAHCLPLILERIVLLKDAEVIEIPAGEKSKSVSTCEFCWNELTRLGADRRSLFVNLGGGMVGDTGGFVASTFMRGIDFINVPTSLLAMVDASAGGKNGINFAGLKNQVGTFTRPRGVFISPVFLKTLPQRELLSGFTEMIKHTLIADAEKWNELKQMESLVDVNWIKLISDSVHIKNRIVNSDFKDRSFRKALNFGHTVGHALESYSLQHDSDPLKHGEAVALGIIAETYLSMHMLHFPEEEANAIIDFIKKHFGHIHFQASNTELLELMKSDKKNEYSEFNFVLLMEPGKAVINQKPEEALVLDAIDFAFRQMNQTVQQT